MENHDRVQTRCTAFDGSRSVASGELRQVVTQVKEIVDEERQAAVLIFDDATAERIEIDFRGTAEDALMRLAQMTDRIGAALPDQPRSPGPGRPKLGVVAREVTLLPRHWDWLNRQPGGASVALRRLVEEARRANSGKDRVRQSQEACYRFLSVMAGDRPGFEEATRALFAGNRERFKEMVQPWPLDIQDYATRLAEDAFSG